MQMIIVVVGLYAHSKKQQKKNTKESYKYPKAFVGLLVLKLLRQPEIPC